MNWRTDAIPRTAEEIDAMGIDRDALFVFVTKVPNDDGEDEFVSGIEGLAMCSWDDDVAYWMQLPPLPSEDSSLNAP